MSIFTNNPFDASASFKGCDCGKHSSQAAHDSAQLRAAADDLPGEEQLMQRSIEGGILSALFPNDFDRRNFICRRGDVFFKFARVYNTHQVTDPFDRFRYSLQRQQEKSCRN